MKSQGIPQVPDSAVALTRLVLRLRRRGRFLDIVTIYHFVTTLWLIFRPAEASLWAAMAAWMILPVVAASVWHASETLHTARDIEDLKRRRREFLSQNDQRVGPPTETSTNKNDV